MLLLESWQAFEAGLLHKSEDARAKAVEAVAKRMPKKVEVAEF